MALHRVVANPGRETDRPPGNPETAVPRRNWSTPAWNPQVRQPRVAGGALHQAGADARHPDSHRRSRVRRDGKPEGVLAVAHGGDVAHRGVRRRDVGGRPIPGLGVEDAHLEGRAVVRLRDVEAKDGVDRWPGFPVELLGLRRRREERGQRQGETGQEQHRRAETGFPRHRHDRGCPRVCLRPHLLDHGRTLPEITATPSPAGNGVRHWRGMLCRMRMRARPQDWGDLGKNLRSIPGACPALEHYPI